MTAQEKDRIENAIRHIKTAADVDGWAMEIAVEAMEKQIPKRPSEGNVHIVYLCPNCHSLNYTTPYCRHCGQAIDWSK
jgi:hypothetical protein